jgi:hypothetical protein
MSIPVFLTKYRKSLIGAIVIITTMVIVIMEIQSMVTISKVVDSDHRLISLDDKITLFNILSIIGIALTLFAGILLIIYNIEATNIRKMKTEQLENSQKEANVKIASLNSVAENAKKEAALANEKAALAELRSKELELQLARIKDRVFITANIPSVKDKLINLPNNNVSLVCLASDEEAVNFLSQISSLFSSSKWDVKIHKPILFGTPQPPGLRIFTNESKFALAKEIQTCFKELGFDSKIILNEYLYDNEDFGIQVGAKERK